MARSTAFTLLLATFVVPFLALTIGDDATSPSEAGVLRKGCEPETATLPAPPADLPARRPSRRCASDMRHSVVAIPELPAPRPEGSTLRGWVVEDNEGVSGVLLEAWYRVRDLEFPLTPVLTDAEGDFEIPLDPILSLPEPEWRAVSLGVALRVPGYAHEVRELAGFPPKRRLAFSLEPAGRLEGEVRGPDGRPVARALVLLVDRADEDDRLAETRTDAHGRFGFNTFEGGDLVLRARHPASGRGELDVEVWEALGEWRSANIKLRPGPVIEGRVVDAQGRPLADSTMVARPWGATDPWGEESGRVRTDKAGGFRFVDLVPGTYLIVGPGFDVEARAGGPQLRVKANLGTWTTIRRSGS